MYLDDEKVREMVAKIDWIPGSDCTWMDLGAYAYEEFKKQEELARRSLEV